MTLEAIHSEAALALGYALFLLAVSLGIEWFAAVSHRHIRFSQAVGFRYDAGARAWRCSEGTYLWFDRIDHEARLVRYRAEAKHCNRCLVRDLCTDSDEGRELAHSLESWPEWEMAKFHAVLAVTLVGLAGFLLAIVLLRHLHGSVEPLSLAGGLALSAACCWRLWRRYRLRPRQEARQPWRPPPSHGHEWGGRAVSFFGGTRRR